jgi:hypothetical protein
MNKLDTQFYFCLESTFIRLLASCFIGIATGIEVDLPVPHILFDPDPDLHLTLNNSRTMEGRNGPGIRLAVSRQQQIQLAGIKMFRLVIISAILFSLLSGCDLKILSSEEEQRNAEEPATTAQQLLVVQFGNEVHGDQRTLVLEDDGKLTLVETNPVAGVTTTRLSQTKVAELVQIFVDHDFLQMENNFLDTAATGEPLYSVDFYLGEEHNQVRSPESGNPADVQAIIDEINHLMALARETAPKVSLHIDQSSIVAGDILGLKLTITNASSQPMTLNFSSSKLFDFMVEPVSAEIQNGDNTSQGSWQWSDDRYYSQVTSQIELATTASRSYSVTWNGRGNDGEQLTGQYAVMAKVTSVPGGVSPQQIVNIIPAE